MTAVDQIQEHLRSQGYPCEEGSNPFVLRYQYKGLRFTAVCPNEDDDTFFKVTCGMMRDNYQDEPDERLYMLSNRLNQRIQVGKVMVDSDGDMEFTVEIFVPKEAEKMAELFDSLNEFVLELVMVFGDMVKNKDEE